MRSIIGGRQFWFRGLTGIWLLAHTVRAKRMKETLPDQITLGGVKGMIDLLACDIAKLLSVRHES